MSDARTKLRDLEERMGQQGRGCPTCRFGAWLLRRAGETIPNTRFDMDGRLVCTRCKEPIDVTWLQAANPPANTAAAWSDNPADYV